MKPQALLLHIPKSQSPAGGGGQEKQLGREENRVEASKNLWAEQLLFFSFPPPASLLLSLCYVHRFLAYHRWILMHSGAGRWQVDIGWTNNSCGRKDECWAESEAIIFPIFTSPPLYGSHLSSSSAERRCPFYTAGLRVRRTDDAGYGDYIRVYTCLLRLYTCLVCRQFCIRRLEPLAKILRPLKQSTSALSAGFRFGSSH